MASDREVRLNGVTVGRVTVGAAKAKGGRVSVAIGFKRDHVGMMHAAAREMDRER